MNTDIPRDLATEPLTYAEALELVIADQRAGLDDSEQDTTTDAELLEHARNVVDTEEAELVYLDSEGEDLLAAAQMIVCQPWRVRTIERIGRKPDFVNHDSAGVHAVWMGNDGVLISITETEDSYEGEYIYRPFAGHAEVDLITVTPTIPREVMVREHTPEAPDLEPWKISVTQQADGMVHILLDDTDDTWMKGIITSEDWQKLRAVGPAAEVN